MPYFNIHIDVTDTGTSYGGWSVIVKNARDTIELVSYVGTVNLCTPKRALLLGLACALNHIKSSGDPVKEYCIFIPDQEVVDSYLGYWFRPAWGLTQDEMDSLRKLRSELPGVKIMLPPRFKIIQGGLQREQQPTA